MSGSAIHLDFTLPLLQWYEQHGRKGLPWQHPRDPYRVWISEVMLQQTQVKTVLPYFTRFIDSFPDLSSLALAAEDEVLAHWSGLGYYSRARNMHKTAKIIANELDGKFPESLPELIKLPGIGDSTAGAIASLAFNKPTAILDGNVKRVLSRYFLVSGLAEQSAVKKKLWALANECMPDTACADYTQAIMDLGATCCTVNNPLCSSCPLQKTCLAYQGHVVASYPSKKLKKKLPVKQQQFLLLHTVDNLIYLEKNPPIGLWGGLWCMPSIDINHCPHAYITQTYQLHADKVQDLMTIKHSFSHFHLHIKALSLQTSTLTYSLAELPGRWFSVSELKKLGLAKPVSVIINQFLHTI